MNERERQYFAGQQEYGFVKEINIYSLHTPQTERSNHSLDHLFLHVTDIRHILADCLSKSQFSLS